MTPTPLVALLSLLLLVPAPTLEEADRLAAAARALEAGPRKDRAVDAALAAYAALIAERPKDLKLVPRLRRRRAALLKHAGRPRAALAEYDAIVTGRGRRRDKARALYDGARLLERASDFGAAEKRLRRAIDDYGDVVRVRAQAAFLRGRVLEKMARPKEAERAYRYVVTRCRDEAKPSIAAYDALALLAIRQQKPRVARRWLRECFGRYEKRATRGDRYGAFIGRLLRDMQAPGRLNERARHDSSGTGTGNGTGAATGADR
jgi:tetratricopeptide (TPR) repeat protein